MTTLRRQLGWFAAATAAAMTWTMMRLPETDSTGPVSRASVRDEGGRHSDGSQQGRATSIRRVQYVDNWGVAPPAVGRTRSAPCPCDDGPGGGRPAGEACVICDDGLAADVQGCGGSERSRILRSVPNADQCGPEPRWDEAQPLPFEVFGPGEYIGPVRQAHVQTYRIRVNDILQLTYLLSRDEVEAYRLQIGDQIRVDSGTDPEVARTLDVMPDGRVSLHLLGYIHVAGQTIPEVAELIEGLYVDKRLIRDPKISVTGVRVNTRLNDIRDTVDNRQGNQGGTGIQTTVMPDGTINLVGLPHPICCQGLSVVELQHEINARYREQLGGLTVTVALAQMAPKFVYVMGEVARPDRYPMQGPTRVSQALALAGGPRLSGNQRQIVIVRHTPEWGTVATKLDLRGFLLGKRPGPADDLWLRDNDIVLVPKHPIQLTNDLITLLLGQGLYSAVPELSGFTQTNLFGVGSLLGN